MRIVGICLPPCEWHRGVQLRVAIGFEAVAHVDQNRPGVTPQCIKFRHQDALDLGTGRGSLQPHTLRFTTAGRIACSTRQLVMNVKIRTLLCSGNQGKDQTEVPVPRRRTTHSPSPSQSSIAPCRCSVPVRRTTLRRAEHIIGGQAGAVYLTRWSGSSEIRSAEPGFAAR